MYAIGSTWSLVEERAAFCRLVDQLPGKLRHQSLGNLLFAIAV